jgi:signal transduction histidine kinase
MPAEIVGLHARDAIGDEAFGRILPWLRAALAGEASVHEFSHEGTGRRIRAAFTPGRTGEGPITGVYILSMDVTEEAQARAALAQTHKRELAAQLTSGLAHDFANLLTIILGLQGRLARLPGLPGEARDFSQATVAAARRGGDLLDRIARIAAPREPRPVPVEVAALLAELGTMAAPLLPAATRLAIDAEAMPGALMLDAGAVQDMLVNLILNARDAIGPAGGTIGIVARPIRDTWLELVVEDDGPGFSEAALRHAFDPFFTTKGAAGSGLGLSMVYDATRSAGGTVRVANRPGGGARVTLRLPLRPAPAALPARLVLLVEDDPALRTEVREMLTLLGHSVVEAASADEALALAEVPGIDLVLSDISLAGGVSGVALIEALAARGHGAARLMMTSLPAAHPLHARARALAPVLAKPFAEGELAQALLSGVPP